MLQMWAKRSFGQKLQVLGLVTEVAKRGLLDMVESTFKYRFWAF